MMSENVLYKLYGFYTFNVLQELTNHEENCENKVCQENGWSNKKVIEVHEVTAWKDYEYTDSDVWYDSDHHDSDSSS